MSQHSDFESIVSDIVISVCSSPDDCNVCAIDQSKSSTVNSGININDEECIRNALHDVSLTDSDHSVLEIPKQLNASSPSSICSTKPLEWDSGADVGYNITSKQQSQDMSTIERIAVSSLVCNANSTPVDYAKQINGRTKSNSLINLNGIELPHCTKSASFEALKLITMKSDTLPKCRSPMNSSLSVSTVVHKLESLSTERIKCLNNTNCNLIVEQEQMFDKFNISANKEQKSSESSKESNSTSSSADTAGSWVEKEFRDSTNTTTDRVNSFEYLPGNTYYNGRNDELEDYSDKEIKQSTKMLVEAMKQNGLTNKFQRKEVFKDIIESFLKNYIQKNSSSSVKSVSDTDQSPVRQDFTSQTSNTVNTIVNKQTNNQSSTITFTSPITSSRYDDDVDSKYDESSMDSGRHIDLKKCKIKKISTPTCKSKNQSVQCSIQDNLTSDSKIKNLHKSSTSESIQIKKNIESSSKIDVHSTTKSKHDMNKDFRKQMLWFQTNYMKIERENQKLWINYHLSHLKSLEKLCHTHEELKKNWNSYKQKQSTNNKPKFRKSLNPISSSSSDFASITKTDSTISSKQQSVNSKCYDTDAESSTTICNHIHYKKGMPVDEPNSLKKCCENTLHCIKKKPIVKKLMTASSQTEPIKESECSSYRKNSNQNSATYTVDQQLKPFSRKNSISYDIIFKPTSRCSKEIEHLKKECKIQNRSVSVACQTNKISSEPKSTLQEYLLTNRPDYVCRAEERQNILSELACLRYERKQLKRDLLITNNGQNKVPPNPLAIKRVMSQREMRKQTERKYRKCPEVKNKRVEIKRKEEYKSNKIMANIFNKRLQKKTLTGKVDLSNSVSVCSL